jgi:hypothetical protein
LRDSHAKCGTATDIVRLPLMPHRDAPGATLCAHGNVSYQLQFKPANRGMFTLRENMLFYEKWTRSFE